MAIQTKQTTITKPPGGSSSPKKTRKPMETEAKEPGGLIDRAVLFLGKATTGAPEIIAVGMTRALLANDRLLASLYEPYEGKAIGMVIVPLGALTMQPDPVAVVAGTVRMFDTEDLMNEWLEDHPDVAMKAQPAPEPGHVDAFAKGEDDK